MLFLLLLALARPSSSNTAQPINVQPLPDGVSVRGGETLKVIDAAWHVYVTLDPPVLPPFILEKIIALTDTFTALEKFYGTAIKLDSQYFKRTVMLNQLNAIPILDHPTMAPTTPSSSQVNHTAKHAHHKRHHHSREKRGLLNVGGKVLNWLFGVATTEQLDRYQHTLNEVVGNQKTIAHAYNSMATLINQTKAFVENLAVRQDELHTHLTKLNEAIVYVKTIVNVNSKLIARVKMLVDLDRYMDVLQLSVDSYIVHVSLFKRQRLELSMGHLTRDLLREDQLRDIISQAAGKYHTIERIQWYYQFITVNPLWIPQSNQLLFKFDLPMLADSHHLLFNIFTHPVPISNSSYKILLDVDPIYALNTQNGFLSAPQGCMGHDPLVCQPLVEYDHKTYQCARALITNQPALSKTCKVKISKHTPHPEVKRIDINEFVFTTWGSQLISRCPGQPPNYITLRPGAYNLSCNMPCSINSGAWSIQCIDQRQLHRRYSLKQLTITSHFNFSTSFNATMLEQNLPDLKLSSKLTPITTSISQIVLPRLNPKFTIEQSMDIVGLISLLLIGLIFIIILALAIRSRMMGTSIALLAGSHVQDHLIPLSPRHKDCDSRYCQPSAPVPRLWPALPPADEVLKLPARLPRDMSLSFEQESLS